jgi:hypothetical protein
MTFTFLGYAALDSVEEIATIPEEKYRLMSHVFTSRAALSLATNAVATFLIAWKLWFVKNNATL